MMRSNWNILSEMLQFGLVLSHERSQKLAHSYRKFRFPWNDIFIEKSDNRIFSTSYKNDV